MVRKLNRGQIKIQQMAFMLMAITLFFVLVGMFVLIFKFSDVKETATQLEEENAMLLVSKLANSPEFSCGNSYGNNKLACIDFDKVMALKKNINRYEDFWGVSNIEVRKIYPEGNSEVFCGVSNYPNCNIIKLRNVLIEGFDESNFVSVCYKKSVGEYFYNKCELGKLIISYEKK